MISFTSIKDKTVIIDATDIESINHWTDGFREFGSRVVTKSGSTYLLKDDVHNVENAVIETLKKVVNAQPYDPYLTLRDQFAMAALPALINKYGKVPLSAKWAYEVADDMMAARSKKEGGEV
ncbi:hypothetical protein [Runella zeae]|uniref:hypothetical protein n=1 Tax=Runella zeae TaxID=94255 RepID=UPI0004295D6D|nr:hypothetical protein [Runella zeae]